MRFADTPLLPENGNVRKSGSLLEICFLRAIFFRFKRTIILQLNEKSGGYDYVGKSLCALAGAYEEKYGETEFVFAGGVMSNSIIKGMLAQRFNASFAEPSLSSDNAVGIAALAVKHSPSGNSMHSM